MIKLNDNTHALIDWPLGLSTGDQQALDRSIDRPLRSLLGGGHAMESDELYSRWYLVPWVAARQGFALVAC